MSDMENIPTEDFESHDIEDEDTIEELKRRIKVRDVEIECLRKPLKSVYDAGLERAAEHLRAKAAIIRGEPPVGPTANVMARIFDGEAAEILALRRTQ